MTILLAVLLLCTCVEGQRSKLDRWPQQFTSFWRQWITSDEQQRPPYKEGRPVGDDVKVYYGTTWYDYTGATKKQFQTFPSSAFAGLGCAYDDNIICQMLNINQTVYTWMLSGPEAHNCCIEQTVWVLPPDFVKDTQYVGKTMIEDQAANAYEVACGADGVGPFGYDYFQGRQTDAGTNWPAGHWGHQLFNLTGWRWQNYLYFDTSPPPASVFDVPAFCAGAKACKQHTPPPAHP